MSNYEPPIDIILHNTSLNFEKDVLKAVYDVGINVNKEELIKALKYDRGMWDKGYNAGRKAGFENAKIGWLLTAGCESDIRTCKNCRKWHSDEGWCDEHSHFVNSDGEACHPWESSSWKMFDENYFCADFAPKEDNNGD